MLELALLMVGLSGGLALLANGIVLLVRRKAAANPRRRTVIAALMILVGLLMAVFAGLYLWAFLTVFTWLLKGLAWLLSGGAPVW